MLNWLLGLFWASNSTKQEKNKEKSDMLTYDQILAINEGINANECKYYLEALNKVLPEYEINTNLRLCHFLAQVLHESGHLKYKSENLNYSASALQSVFKKYFPTKELAEQYARKPEKIANRVYANRMGNGNEASGEGFAFRGRGLIQLTGKTNYERCGKALGLDLVSNPDLIINDPIVCVKSACWFWNTNNLSLLADKDDCIAITKRINGGTNGLTERKKLLTIAKQILFDK